MPNDSYGYILIILVAVIIAGLLFYQYVLPKIQTQVKPEYRLVEFIRSNLREELIAPLYVKSENSSFYSVNWSINETNFTAVLIKNSKNDGVKELRAFVTIPFPSNSPEVISGMSILKKSFENFTCKDYGETNQKLCEAFSEGANGKSGVALFVLDKSILVLCEIPKGSEVYERNTCAVF